MAVAESDKVGNQDRNKLRPLKISVASRIQEDTKRDYILEAHQAKEYGIIDDVMFRKV